MSRGALLVALLVALLAALAPLSATDLAYAARLGETILATGRLPSPDTLTVLGAGRDWLDGQWLTQVLFAPLLRHGGPGAVGALRAAVVAGGALATVAIAARSGVAPLVAVMLALAGAALAAPAAGARAQLVGLAVAPALLWWLGARHARPVWRTALGAALLGALWANGHGSFVLAPLIAGTLALDDRIAHRPLRTSLVALGAIALATCAGPLGPASWLHAARYAASATARLSDEWAPLWGDPALALAAAPILIGLVALIIRGARARALPEPGSFALGVALLGLALWSERALGFAGVLAIPLLAPAARGLRAGRPDPLGAPARPALGLAALALVTLVLARPVALADAPRVIVAPLRALPSGSPVFVPQVWASWAEWSAPGVRPLIDSRLELLEPADAARYRALAEGRSLVDLEALGVRAVVTSRTHTPGLAAAMAASGWRRVAGDADAEVWSR